jgi:hypothetical protein
MTSSVKWDVIISPENPVSIFLKDVPKVSAIIYSLRISNTPGKNSRTQILAVFNGENYNSLYSLYREMIKKEGMKASTQPWKGLQYYDKNGIVKSLELLKYGIDEILVNVKKHSTMSINGIHRIKSKFLFLIQDNEPGSVRWISEREWKQTLQCEKERQSVINIFVARIKARLPLKRRNIESTTLSGVQIDGTGRMIWILKDENREWESFTKEDSEILGIFTLLDDIDHFCTPNHIILDKVSQLSTSTLHKIAVSNDWFKNEVYYLSQCGNVRIANLLKNYIE